MSDRTCTHNVSGGEDKTADRLSCDTGNCETETAAPEFSKPLELFAENKVVKICAPMVRYSK